MNNFSSLKNILFDLGGVIIDLDVNATLEAFLNLGFNKEFLSYPENLYTDIYFKYETGKFTTEEFRDAIRERSGISFGNRVFDDAWCQMLVRVPKKRTDLLTSLAGQYDLYMLSNTSPIHIDRFEKMFLEASGSLPGEVFRKCYYSYETGYHKPDAASFQHVLDDANIKASETLFLDDNIHNIKAAAELGYNVIHITENLKMEDLGYNR